jgi:hypothetical protein
MAPDQHYGLIVLKRLAAASCTLSLRLLMGSPMNHHDASDGHVTEAFPPYAWSQ